MGPAGGRGALSGFHPTYSLSVRYTGSKQVYAGLLAVLPRAEQSRQMSLAFVPGVGLKIRFYGSMKPPTTGHVTLTNIPHWANELYSHERHTNHLPQVIFSSYSQFFSFFYGVLFCEITTERSYFTNELMPCPTHLAFHFHTLCAGFEKSISAPALLLILQVNWIRMQQFRG